MQVEAIIYVMWMTDRYLTTYNSSKVLGNPQVVYTCLNHTINNFSNPPKQWVSMKHHHSYAVVIKYTIL